MVGSSALGTVNVAAGIVNWIYNVNGIPAPGVGNEAINLADNTVDFTLSPINSFKEPVEKSREGTWRNDLGGVASVAGGGNKVDHVHCL